MSSRKATIWSDLWANGVNESQTGGQEAISETLRKSMWEIIRPQLLQLQWGGEERADEWGGNRGTGWSAGLEEEEGVKHNSGVSDLRRYLSPCQGILSALNLGFWLPEIGHCCFVTFPLSYRKSLGANDSRGSNETAPTSEVWWPEGSTTYAFPSFISTSCSKQQHQSFRWCSVLLCVHIKSTCSYCGPQEYKGVRKIKAKCNSRFLAELCRKAILCKAKVLGLVRCESEFRIHYCYWLCGLGKLMFLSLSCLLYKIHRWYSLPHL